jgi:hypothetical protein
VRLKGWRAHLQTRRVEIVGENRLSTWVHCELGGKGGFVITFGAFKA